MAADEVSHHFLQLIVSARQPVVLDRHVLTFGVASFGQTFAERGHITHDGFWCCGVDNPDHRHSRLLPARRERPRRSYAAECDQQFPPSDGDCHAPLPREVRKWNDTTPRACCP